jgi:dTDP-glucose 4,6-dehydratase
VRVFVTGGAGFIGSNYVRHLLETGNVEVTVFDALTYAGNRATLADLEHDPRVAFVHGDVCDREAVGRALAGHDEVVHFAAETHVDRSLLDPDVFVRTNCSGTNVLCDLSVGLGIERFVHVSTDEVYGSIEVGSFRETDALSPRSPYSASKAGSDLIALAYHETHGLPVVVTRSSNQFGPYQFPEKLIPFFVTNLVEGHKVPLYGDGQNVRDWMFVADGCAGIDVVRRSGIVGEVYNVGAGNELTNRQITDRLLALLDRDESWVEHVEDRKGHDRRYSIDTTRVRALGWSPEHDVDDALERTVRFYLDRRDWWEPLRSRVRNR